MGLFNSINISATGLTAERLRMDIISENIANAETTRTASGGPYRRKIPIYKELESNNFESVFNGALNNNSGEGVEVAGIKEDMTPFIKKYDPNHPDANEEGYVLLPNVNIVTEMINMVSASKAYEANVTAVNSTKSMMMKALEIGR
ncbi:flagellar basal body rod protein FlgC [Clostridiaceae bacterium HSG29]|nr:flagellar basal body rod protein FlgC [Clostridiaceae bacterium HSG29]